MNTGSVCVCVCVRACAEQQGAETTSLMICTAHQISSQRSSGACGRNGEDVHLYLVGTTERRRLFKWPRRRQKDNIKIDLKETDGDGSRQWKVVTCDSVQRPITCCPLYSTFRLHKRQGTYWLDLVQSVSSDELCSLSFSFSFSFIVLVL